MLLTPKQNQIKLGKTGDDLGFNLKVVGKKINIGTFVIYHCRFKYWGKSDS